MPLSTGDKLGPYEILALIGKGGMGEVYRARDSRLNRDVAIKTSAAQFTERFEREAKAVAALNHPNICHVYDVGPNYLVMELLEGPTLAERISEGAIPLEESLKIAAQIADALEAAHEKDITHRDLKPANIKVKADGVVKVLDFGLAKIGGTPPAQSDNSPTISMAATQAGVILGTAAYMSPEQARGKPVDKRTDIWAFGVVLYETVTGQRLFQGEDLTETLASVVMSQLALDAAPFPVRKLLRKCLQKDPKKRLRDIADAWELIEEVPPEAPVTSQAPVPAPSRWGRITSAAAGVFVLIAATLGVALWRATRAVDRPMTRLSVDLGPEAVRGGRVTAVLSPDGTRIVYTGRAKDGLVQLFTRRLDETEATPLSGTDLAANTPFPFFSPDGQWIGFFGGGKIRKVAAQGGSAITIGDSPANYGASWGEDGNIIFGSGTGLRRISASGGVAQPLKAGAEFQLFPQILPGSAGVLFNSVPGTFSSLEDSDIAVHELATGKQKTLLHGGYFPRYLATAADIGHLVYIHEGTLFGVAFDSKKLELRGTPTPLLDDVAASNSDGGQFAFSETGTFVYLSGRSRADAYPILSMDASGKTAPLLAQTGAYDHPRFSPDGKRLAYTAAGTKGIDVWVQDLERDTPTQLTFTGPGAHELAWAPDSKHLVFEDGTSLWWIRADGSGQPQKLLEKSDQRQGPRPASFAPDGRLVFSPSVNGLPDIFTLPVDLSDPEHPKPGKPEPFLIDPQVVEVDPSFSPDGKFLAYSSTESGPSEVYVRPFPGPGGKWKISTAGGKFPAWSRAGHELLFLGDDDRIMAVSYTVQGDSFNAGRPRVWSATQVRRTGVQQNFDLSSDGKRVAMFPRQDDRPQGSLHATFLLNFFDEVRRRVPVGK